MPVKYRADQVGSLLRPPELLAARANGTDPARLRALEDQHILRVLVKQKELGFEIFLPQFRGIVARKGTPPSAAPS